MGMRFLVTVMLLSSLFALVMMVGGCRESKEAPRNTGIPRDEAGSGQGPSHTLKYDKSAIAGKIRASTQKVVLIGVDGATWDVILPLVNENKMPNLRKLMERGSWGILRSEEQSTSPVIWNTIVTGVTKEKHGIDGFVVKVPGKYESIPLTSDYRKRKALWNIMSDFDKKSGVINWWASWPAEKVNGFIVSNSLFYLPWLESEKYIARERATYPSSLYKDISRFMAASKPEADREISKIMKWRPASGDFTTKGSAAAAVLDDKTFNIGIASYDTQSLIELETKSGRMAPYLYLKYKPDFFAVYFQGIDVVSHHWWKYMEPISLKGRYMYDLTDIDKYGKIIPNYYAWTDQLIGKLLDVVDKDTIIMVVSDHGFQGSPSDYGRIIDLNKLFRKLGWLNYDGAGEIDWAKTKLCDFSQSEFWEPERRLFINVRGREPQGVVEKGVEYERFRDEVMETLKGLKTSEDGWPLFEEVRLPVKGGTIAGEQPDLVVKLNLIPREKSVRYRGKIILLKEFIFPRPISGNHHVDGIVLVAGPGIKERNIIEGADIYDVFPTLLYAFGFPVPKDIEGELMKGIFKEDFLIKYPVAFVDTYEEPRQAGRPTLESSSADKELKERLKSLGYIQ